MKSQALRPSSARKREAVLDAAAHVFLRDGFSDASMDEVSRRSGVSKQTVYSHFGSKDALFAAVVTRATAAAADAVAVLEPDPPGRAELAAHLELWARSQLDVVLDPPLLALRRLVIAEAVRFPALARAFWDGGPGRSMATMAERLGRLAERGLLVLDDPATAARTLNWLVMAEPLNAVMMLGDGAIPDPAARTAGVREAVRVFLAAHAGSDGASPA